MSFRTIETVYEKKGVYRALPEEQKNAEIRKFLEGVLTGDLENEKNRDASTGLFNSEYFKSALLQVTKQSQKAFLVSFEISRSEVEAGEEEVKMVTREIKSVLRKSEVFARDEGGQFRVLLQNVDHEKAIAVVERIYRATQKDKIKKYFGGAGKIGLWLSEIKTRWDKN